MPVFAKWLGNAIENLLPSYIPFMEVSEAIYINSAIKKIRFKGNLQGMDFQIGYAVAIRVNDKEYRNYTGSFVDMEHGLLEITVHLHDQAPGTCFMDRLQKGDKISIPRGKKMYDSAASQHLIFGDETTLGLACAFQSALKNNQHRYHFCFELDEDNYNVPGLLGLENYTVISKLCLQDSGDLLNALSWQLQDWQTSNIILTGNARSIQLIRKAVKMNGHLGKLHLQAYWLDGKSGL